MKKYIKSPGVWAIAILCGLADFLISSLFLSSFVSAIIGVASWVICAFMIAIIFDSKDKKFDPIAQKYAAGNIELTESVRILSIKGQRVNQSGRIIVTLDGKIMVLLPQNGFKFTLDEDHSFIFIEKEQRLLLAKSDVDIQLTSGVMLNNLSRISTAIASKGFRIEQREHAPY